MQSWGLCGPWETRDAGHLRMWLPCPVGGEWGAGSLRAVPPPLPFWAVLASGESPPDPAHLLAFVES